MQRLGRHSLDGDGSAVLHDDLVDLGVAHEIQVVVLGARGVYVSVRRVASTACVSVDPFEPVLCAVAGTEVLEVIDKGDALGLGGAEEVILDGVGVVTEGNFNGSLVTVDIWVYRVALVSLVLPHERKELIGRPSLGLEVVVWRCISHAIHRL